MSDIAVIDKPEILVGLSVYGLTALEQGAHHGFARFPGPRNYHQEHWPELLEMERRGLIRLRDVDWPQVTELARVTFGAKPQSGDKAWLDRLNAARKSPAPVADVCILPPEAFAPGATGITARPTGDPGPRQSHDTKPRPRHSGTRGNSAFSPW